MTEIHVHSRDLPGLAGSSGSDAVTGASYQPAGPGITDPACREVLEAVREALKLPWDPARDRLEILQERSDRAVAVVSALEWILKPGAYVDAHLGRMRETIRDIEGGA